MPFFSICSSIVSEGRLAETLASMALAEPDFGPRIGVLSRHFYQLFILFIFTKHHCRKE